MKAILENGYFISFGELALWIAGFTLLWWLSEKCCDWAIRRRDRRRSKAQ